VGIAPRAPGRYPPIEGAIADVAQTREHPPNHRVLGVVARGFHDIGNKRR
jgi:hypothetical protein